MKERSIILSAPMVRAAWRGIKTVTRRVVNMDRLRVRLHTAVRSEFEDLTPDAMVRAGTYHATMNNYGAVSLTKQNFGVKPGEFHFVCPYLDGATMLIKEGGKSRWLIYPSHPQKLWVREGWLPMHTPDEFAPRSERLLHYPCGGILYRADEWEGHYLFDGAPWRVPIFMPRFASRMDLSLVSVRIERLSEIDDADAMLEGIEWWSKDGSLRKYAPADREGDGPCWPWVDCPQTAIGAYIKVWEELHGVGSWATNPWVWRVQFVPVRRDGFVPSRMTTWRTPQSQPFKVIAK